MVYIEEYVIEDGISKSYGAILVQQKDEKSENRKLSYYKKNLRLLLDQHKELKDFLKVMNPHFKYERWGAITNEELDKIGIILDNPD